jgi:hypothetical protein
MEQALNAPNCGADYVPFQPVAIRRRLDMPVWQLLYLSFDLFRFFTLNQPWELCASIQL